MASHPKSQSEPQGKSQAKSQAKGKSKTTTSPAPDLLAGTLDMLVLRTLEHEPLHGYGIARAIEAASGARLTIEEGSLYPALYRLERRGDIIAYWKITPTKRRARYYELTKEGTKSLRTTVMSWVDVSGAVNRVLGLPPSLPGLPNGPGYASLSTQPVSQSEYSANIPGDTHWGVARPQLGVSS